MNLEDLITEKIVEYCEPLNIIFVIGYTKTGKITIARKLAKELNRTLLISDEFIEKYGHEDAITYLENELQQYYYSVTPIIVEGILGFRLLRKLAKDGYIVPDLIIKTQCNEATITHFYNKDGEGYKITRALGFNKGLEKIWNEYLYFIHSNFKKPKLLNLNTSIY